MSYTTVKTSLNQFCKNDYLKSKLNDVVLNSNKVVFEAYAFANLHILRLLEEGKPLPKLNQSFFQVCCAYVSAMRDKKEKAQMDDELNITFDKYQVCRPETFKPAFRDNISIILNYLAADMEVATTNHLVLNFYKRFSGYVRAKYPDTTAEYRYGVCKGLYEEKYLGQDPVVLEYRKKLGDKPPYDKYIKKDPSHVLSVYYEILDFNIKTNGRLFSLLPHKGGFQMSYITIDASVLRDLIVGEHLVPLKDNRKKAERDYELPTISQLRKDIETNSRPYWEKFFNITQHETTNRKFALFKTDGKTVSIILEVPERPKPVKEQKKSKKAVSCPYKIEDYGCVVGIDPGYRYTFVGFNNQDEVVKCSGAQYYHAVGINRVNARQKRCYDNSPEFLDYKSNMPSSKTTDSKVLMTYLTYALKGIDNAFQVHFNNPFRKWKFTTFIKKQKVFHSLCKKITKKTNRHDTTTNALVGFGDWSNPRDSIIRGHRRGPVNALKEELKRWCPVVSVNEFRTSKLCCCCHCETTKVKFDGKQVNSVLRCSNNECGITIDRDINGSKNIYMVFNKMLKGETLPKAFCR